MYQDRGTREELHQLVSSKSTRTAAKEFGLSDDDLGWLADSTDAELWRCLTMRRGKWTLQRLLFRVCVSGPSVGVFGFNLFLSPS